MTGNTSKTNRRTEDGNEQDESGGRAGRGDRPLRKQPARQRGRGRAAREGHREVRLPQSGGAEQGQGGHRGPHAASRREAARLGDDAVHHRGRPDPGAGAGLAHRGQQGRRDRRLGRGETEGRARRAAGGGLRPLAPRLRRRRAGRPPWRRGGHARRDGAGRRPRDAGGARLEAGRGVSTRSPPPRLRRLDEGGGRREGLRRGRGRPLAHRPALQRGLPRERRTVHPKRLDGGREIPRVPPRGVRLRGEAAEAGRRVLRLPRGLGGLQLPWRVPRRRAEGAPVPRVEEERARPRAAGLQVDPRAVPLRVARRRGARVVL